MRQYLDFLHKIHTEGTDKSDRTGTGTRSIFGHQMRFNLRDGFPLVTTKRVHLKSIIYELLWFLRGETNVKWLQERGVTIWDEWADEKGELGPVYGSQWRRWPVLTMTSPGMPVVEHDERTQTHFNAKVQVRYVDQIAALVQGLQKNPDSRRHIVSAWNLAEVERMALPPCHTMFQLYVANNTLSCQLYQRSADAVIGVPFNIASYALLTMMLAQQCDMEVGDFIWTGGDCHIYSNHFEQVQTQLARQPFGLPTMTIRKATSIFDYTYEDFTLSGYESHPGIKAPIAV